jgi:endoglucanase
VLYPTANSAGNWTEKDLKESGIKTRELLRKYNKFFTKKDDDKPIKE